MLQYRPHHFLCSLGFSGKGYSDEFVHNFKTIVERLRDGGDGIEISVVGISDSICGPCPNKRGIGCDSEEKIRRLDAAHSAVLGIVPGNVLTWGEAKARIAARMTDEAFERCCAPCAWRALGVCKSALIELRATVSGVAK